MLRKRYFKKGHLSRNPRTGELSSLAERITANWLQQEKLERLRGCKAVSGRIQVTGFWGWRGAEASSWRASEKNWHLLVIEVTKMF